MLTAWKLIPTMLMAGALVAGFTARPPREPVEPVELRRLVAAVAALYVVGAIALINHRTPLAGIVFGSGLLLCSLALWLSRAGRPPRDDSDGDGGGGSGGQPPLEPLPLGPSFDWSFYEEQFREPVH